MNSLTTAPTLEETAQLPSPGETIAKIVALSASLVANVSTESPATRTERASQIVTIFASMTGLDSPEEDSATKLGDLLADLLHWCDANGVDFDDAVRRARNHHHEEVLEGN